MAMQRKICTSLCCSCGSWPNVKPASMNFAGDPPASPVPWKPAAASKATTRSRRSAAGSCLANKLPSKSSTLSLLLNAFKTAESAVAKATFTVRGAFASVVNFQAIRINSKNTDATTRMIQTWIRGTPSVNSVAASKASNNTAPAARYVLSMGSTCLPRPGFGGFGCTTTLPADTCISPANKRPNAVLEAMDPPTTPMHQPSRNCMSTALSKVLPLPSETEALSAETIKCLSEFLQALTMAGGPSKGASSSPSTTVLPPKTWPHVSFCFLAKSRSCVRKSARNFCNSRCASTLPEGSAAIAASKSAIAAFASAS
mmetsp:Transcript_81082/g.204117  ORF Transcript_81082/g.204117 Transcript_81082/m.204117 type:complete len:314 (-) Transcript_81082:531-1472(-)